MIDRRIALAAASLVIARERGDPLQQRRFAGAVLADNDGDGVLEAEFEVVAQKRKTKRIGRAIGNARGIEPKPPEVRRRQIDVAISA
jgi:hypothetical protein